MVIRVLLMIVVVSALALTGCSGGDAGTTEETGAAATGGGATGMVAGSGDVLATFPVDSFDGVIDREALSLDADGCGGTPALLAEAEEPTVYQLFSTGDLDVEDALLVYSARVRCDGVQGEAMLEMWCEFPELGEFFSRGMDSVVSGTSEWTDLRTVFRLEAGQNPSNVKLNLAVNGTGRVWIDNIKVSRAPLP